MSGLNNGLGRSQTGLAPLLRWAGSKRKLLPDLVRHVPASFARYIEPFSGSACLFFALGPNAAVLSDINSDLIHTYRVLRAHPILLYEAVTRMPCTDDFYYSLRDRPADAATDIDRAARFVYLNRNCFNGVYRTNREGRFNVPRGKRPGALPDRRHFIRCARALKSATLINADFQETLECANTCDFVYLDPPYAKLGRRRRGEYGCSSFDTRDIKRLAECLRALDSKDATFLLSYANCREIEAIRSSWYSRTLLVRRHVAGFNHHRAIVDEILVSNRWI